MLAKRYLEKYETGQPVEKPEEMFWRVACVVAREDSNYRRGGGGGAGPEALSADDAPPARPEHPDVDEREWYSQPHTTVAIDPVRAIKLFDMTTTRTFWSSSTASRTSRRSTLSVFRARHQQGKVSNAERKENARGSKRAPTVENGPDQEKLPNYG